MKTLRALALTLALAAAPTALQAQDGWWDWSLRGISVRVDFGTAAAQRYVPDVVYAPGARAPYGGDYRRAPARTRGVKAKGRKGPPFCRSGAGHPVHGLRWCLDKGFAPSGHAYRPVRWERRRWARAVPRVPIGHRWGSLGPTLGHRELVGILGPTVYGRLDRERIRLGGRHALSGRWIRPAGTSLVLQIRSGPVAVAELTDFGPDGLVDVVLVVGG